MAKAMKKGAAKKMPMVKGKMPMMKGKKPMAKMAVAKKAIAKKGKK